MVNLTGLFAFRETVEFFDSGCQVVIDDLIRLLESSLRYLMTLWVTSSA